MRNARKSGILLLAAGLLLAGCTAPPVATPTSEAPPSVTPTTATPSPSLSPSPSPTASPLPSSPTDVVTGLRAPWSVAFAGGSTLISERDSARILEVTPDGSVREVAVIAGVVHGGEGGVLGLAVHEGALFVYATTPDGNRVTRHALIGGAGSRSLGRGVTVIDGLPAARVHNGGRIAFGPDGMLYVPVGDARDPWAAQDPERMNGKILRLLPDGGVPTDNPTPGSPVYSLGHRNVQGLAWSADGRMFASEFGQNTWDELNVITAGGNYGWPDVEGTNNGSYVDPIAQWRTHEASPSGIAVVGDAVVLANLRGEVLRVVSIDDPDDQREYYDELGRMRDVVLGPDGAVWLLTNNTDGRGDPRAGDDHLLRVSPGALGID